jgi:hypothetical protein
MASGLLYFIDHRCGLSMKPSSVAYVEAMILRIVVLLPPARLSGLWIEFLSSHPGR